MLFSQLGCYFPCYYWQLPSWEEKAAEGCQERGRNGFLGCWSLSDPCGVRRGGGGMLHPHCFLLAELRSRGCDLPWVLQVPGGRGGKERQGKQSLVLLESQVEAGTSLLGVKAGG